MERGVFLDRDGVLIEDVGLVTDMAQVRILAGVPAALHALRTAGFRLVIVSNQAVVARGLAREEDVAALHREIQRELESSGGGGDAWYFCPHHPEATLERYRVACGCRKPEPGMLIEAAHREGIDLQRSYMVGDRVTDVLAGAAAGCKTVWLQTGKHMDPPIRAQRPIDTAVCADHTCADLAAAARWILTAV